MSYAWNSLIEAFNTHIIGGRQHYTNLPEDQRDGCVRFMAREPRTRRRMLARTLLELMERTPADQRGARVVGPSKPGDSYFVFLLFPHYNGCPAEDYRRGRRNHLEHYCRVVKLKFPEAQHIVGIATDAGLGKERSEDIMYYDASEWTEEDENEARQIQKDFNVLVEGRMSRTVEQEYPLPKESKLTMPPFYDKRQGGHKTGRNEPCLCGSGIKYKRCHGR